MTLKEIEEIRAQAQTERLGRQHFSYNTPTEIIALCNHALQREQDVADLVEALTHSLRWVDGSEAMPPHGYDKCLALLARMREQPTENPSQPQQAIFQEATR